jgi:adenylate cyclase, class 2
MKEIEVKILEIDPEEIVKKLKGLGAEKIESGLIHITAFDFPDDRLRNKGSYVRVRTFGHRTELVLKQPIERKDFKIMEEIETNVDDYDATVKLFHTLGMKVFARQEKYRASYRIGRTRFELDKYPDIPWMMEVEAPTKEDVKKGLELLGFNMGQANPKSSREIFESYGYTNSFFTFAEKGESPDYDSLFG